jgi:aldehyde dehydrogenase (NAD+)
MFSHEDFLIGSRWAKPAGSRKINVISPVTEELIGSVPEPTTADIDYAVAVARAAFDEGPWPRMSVQDRAAILLRAADLLQPELGRAVDIQIDEMGGARKFIEPFTLGLAQYMRSVAALASALPTREVRDGFAGKVVVLREPIGVVAAIIPWNSPLGTLMTKLLPALLTGCPLIVKPAPESPLSAYVIADVLARAGLPEGVISIIAGGREIGEYLISHAGVDKVSFTGSTAAGRRVGAICGEQIKPATLELGGKSAAIILDDVDLDRHLSTIIESSIPNNGQACVATTRVLAPAGRYNEIVEGLVAGVASMQMGDPRDRNVDLGPLVSARQRERVESFIKAGVVGGARLVLGGGRAKQAKGWYVNPTIFADVDNSMRIAQEEIFGPVLAVIRYESQEQAIRIANDSMYGLGGAVFTADTERGLKVAAEIRTGSCVINDGSFAGGGGPFGGYKRSGIGRELSTEGITSHYLLKSISLPPGVVPA